MDWVWTKRQEGKDRAKYGSPPQGIVSLERGAGAGLPWLTCACVHLFPTLCSLKSFWQPEIIHGGRIHHKNWQPLQIWPLFPLESLLLSTYQHSSGKSLSAGQLIVVWNNRTYCLWMSTAGKSQHKDTEMRAVVIHTTGSNAHIHGKEQHWLRDKVKRKCSTAFN